MHRTHFKPNVAYYSFKPNDTTHHFQTTNYQMWNIHQLIHVPYITRGNLNEKEHSDNELLSKSTNSISSLFHAIHCPKCNLPNTKRNPKKNPDTIHTKPNKIKQHPDHQNSKNSWKRKKLRKIRNLSYQPSRPEWKIPKPNQTM